MTEIVEATHALFQGLNALDWIGLIGAVAAFLTALFTGYSAFALWQDRRELVNAEWSISIYDGVITVTCEILNKSGSTLDGDRVSVKGPVEGVHPGDRREKHHSWLPNSAPAMFSVKPDQQGTFSFHIHPDASLLRKQAESRSSHAMLWLNKLSWRLLSWRVPAGPKFSISLIARRRRSQIRSIRLRHTINIYPQQAMNIADTIDAKGANK